MVMRNIKNEIMEAIAILAFSSAIVYAFMFMTITFC